MWWLPVLGEGRGVRLCGISMMRASSINCPLGKWSSSVLRIDSSGPSTLSLLEPLPVESRVAILSVMSGESILLPSEFAYFIRIASRTLSTRSSSSTSILVPDEAPVLLTHIFLFIATDCCTCRLGMGGTGGMSVVVTVTVLALRDGVSRVGGCSRVRDRDLDRRRLSLELEPTNEALRERTKGILILSNPMTGTFFLFSCVEALMGYSYCIEQKS